MNDTIPVITIDGPSGSGKGTISLLLAEKLGWHFLDSGAIYRVLAYAALQKNLKADAVAQLAELATGLPLRFEVDSSRKTTQIFYEDLNVTEKIREETVGVMASKIAVYPPIRTALLQKQRDFRKKPGLVTDGRDMGTVVFPDATHKIFLSASLQERATRRFKELQVKEKKAVFEEILVDITARDQRDIEREVSPLIPAKDAILIDTSGLSIVEVLHRVLQVIHK